MSLKKQQQNNVASGSIMAGKC